MQNENNQADMNKIWEALGMLGEGMAAILQGIKSLQEAGLRGADRGVALLKHAQENGDIGRRVEAQIGDKFGVLLDVVKDVGQKVEASLEVATNTEDGLVQAMDKIDKLGVEKWREAIKHVEAEGITEPMHADVKAEPTARPRPDGTYQLERGTLHVGVDLAGDMADAVAFASDKKPTPTLRNVLQAIDDARALAVDAGISFDFTISTGA